MAPFSPLILMYRMSYFVNHIWGFNLIYLQIVTYVPTDKVNHRIASGGSQIVDVVCSLNLTKCNHRWGHHLANIDTKNSK